MDTGHCYARILFKNFIKGFDLVDHNVLCSELCNLGVYNVLITWIGSLQRIFAYMLMSMACAYTR